MKTMPFVVSREHKTSLIEQVEGGLRSAIATGEIQVGTRLPNLKEMAAELDVSEFVTRRAVQKLAREGLLTARPSTGIVVCGSNLKTWRGHVLNMHWSEPSMYYHGVLNGMLEERLHAANVLISSVHVTWDDQADGFAKVRSELNHVVSLAVIQGPAAGLDALLAEHDIPFIHLRSDYSPKAVQGITFNPGAVLPALRDHCLMCGIRSVVTVRPKLSLGLDIAPALMAAGIAVDTLNVEPLREVDNPENIERGALQAMQYWLDGRKILPDLLWFTDDFVARGALVALLARGIRIPEDVQVITWANKGLGPVFTKPFTRVENDPKTHGAIVAHCILDRLDGKSNGHGLVEMVPKFIVGETTRQREA